jgi:hypothetical protein
MEANKSKRSLASSVSTPCAPALTLANKAFTGFDSCHIEEGAFAAKFSSSPCSSSSSTSPASASLSRAVIAVSAALRRFLGPVVFEGFALVFFGVFFEVLFDLLFAFFGVAASGPASSSSSSSSSSLSVTTAVTFFFVVPLGRPFPLPLALGAIARGGNFEKFE